MDLIRGAEKGVTLLELLIVLMIIGILVTAAVKTWDVSLQRSRFNSTLKEMDNLVWAIAGNPNLITGGKRSDFGYVGDIGMLPITLRDLYENPSNFTHWRGPYIKPTFQESPSSYMIDAWGDTYVYPNPMTIYDTSPVYVRSYAGGSSIVKETWLTKLIASKKRDIVSNIVAGNFYDAHGDPPGISPGSLDSIYVKLYYPRLGRIDSLTPILVDSPNFSVAGVPIGNHKIKAIGVHRTGTTRYVDSAEKYVCVYPRIGASDVRIHFPALLFGVWETGP